MTPNGDRSSPSLSSIAPGYFQVARQTMTLRERFIGKLSVSSNLPPQPIWRLKRTTFSHGVELYVRREQPTVWALINVQLNSLAIAWNSVTAFGNPRSVRQRPKRTKLRFRNWDFLFQTPASTHSLYSYEMLRTFPSQPDLQILPRQWKIPLNDLR